MSEGRHYRIAADCGEHPPRSPTRLAFGDEAMTEPSENNLAEAVVRAPSLDRAEIFLCA